MLKWKTHLSALQFEFKTLLNFWRFVRGEWHTCCQRYDTGYWRLKAFYHQLEWILDNLDALWQYAGKTARG
jgi:hypothetical protein